MFLVPVLPFELNRIVAKYVAQYIDEWQVVKRCLAVLPGRQWALGHQEGCRRDEGKALSIQCCFFYLKYIYLFLV
jgi:hypothetical protein